MGLVFFLGPWTEICRKTATSLMNQTDIIDAPQERVDPRLLVRPDFAFMRRHAAHWLALAFGAGLFPIAPGTVGTLWAWLVFLLLQPWLDPVGWAVVLGLGLLLGWWACTLTARDLQVADPGCIVWDEVLAFWLILVLVMPTGFWGQLGAFVLFRFFDAAKPQPVRWADRVFKGTGWRGGFGIIFDDLVAAFCTLLVIALWRLWF